MTRVANRDLLESGFRGWRVGGKIDPVGMCSIIATLAHGSGASWSARFAAERVGGR